MNILIVGPWDHRVGGVDYVAGNLAGYLERRGHKVLFIHPDQNWFLERRVTTWGFNGYRLRLSGPLVEKHRIRGLIAFVCFLPLTLVQIGRVLVQNKIDVINLHFPSPNMFYFAICARLLSIPLITSIHGADIFPDGMRRNHYAFGLQMVLKISDRIVAPSKAFLREFVDLFANFGHKSLFIHNGVNRDEIESVDKTEGADCAKRYILCMAAHKAKKSIDVLIRAFAKVAVKEKEVDLFIVGNGPLRAEHEKLAQELGVDARVKFFNEVGRAQAIQLLKGCEIFVLPSRSEPFGIVVAEAMACEKPVVASAVGGLREIVKDGETGILVEPQTPEAFSRAICAILRDTGLMSALGRNGYARVMEKFLCDHNGSAYEELFQALAGKAANQTIKL